MKKDISIIVPIYNSEKYLKKCIDSIINQDKKELEIILVNDGSTDNSLDIINSYKDDRIRVFNNNNQGIGKTRNFGIKKANGKYIMFLDSDDYLEYNACSKLYEKIKKDNLDLVICDFNIIKGRDVLKEKLISFENTSLVNNPLLINKINLSPWNKIYKTELIKNNNLKFIENLKYEDAPFVLMSMDKAFKIGKVDYCLINYVIHNNSETTIRDDRVFDIIEIVKIIKKHFKDKSNLKENIDKLIVRILTNYTIQQRAQIDLSTGLKFIDDVFDYLKREIPDYKDNKYYSDRGFFRRIIEKNKFLTKIYVKIKKSIQ